ncbi:MAG: TolC family protein [Bacteroidota bacterium]
MLQDNKWTLSFSTPIFMRSARGDLQLNAIKQQRTELDRNQKAGELELKLRQYQGQVTFLTDQLVISRQIVNDYQSLLEAEQIKFNLGESSVFLLNSRENKLLEARLKLVKQEADLAKAMAGRRWVTGGN